MTDYVLARAAFRMAALAVLCAGLFFAGSPYPADAAAGEMTLVQSMPGTAAKRNNWAGYSGMQFTTGAAITVSQLGRWVIAGNKQSHRLQLIDAATKAVLAETTLNAAGLPAGFAYAPLPAPVTLAANRSYYLVSFEYLGGDLWYDNAQIVTPTTLIKSIDHGIFNNGGTWYPGGLANNPYIPTDLKGSFAGSAAPTASLTPNPASITAGQSSTLTWSSTNATSCTGSGFATGSARSGSVSVTPVTTTTYSVTCTNGSTSATANATITVTGSAPTASLTANPASITAGKSSTLSWSSTNATACTGNGFSTANALSGSLAVTPAATKTFSVTCTKGSASATASATVTVTATAPTASLTASPASITAGQSSTLSWSSANATSCTGTGFSTGGAVSGSVTVTPATTITYLVVCSNGSNSASATATVSIGAGSTASKDEFAGPFSTWTNVKTAFGAKGDGVTDDTSSIQTALNSLSSSNGTLYFPAGTYKITGTLSVSGFYFWNQIIGHDPADTIIKWYGPSGGTMLNAAGYGYSKEGRITWDGSGTAGTAVYHASTGASYGTNMMHFDEVFKNAQYGVRIGVGSFQDSEHNYIRCQFLNNTIAGLSSESWNTLDIWVWLSTFQNNRIGVQNTNGNYSVFSSNFFNSSVADMWVNTGVTFSIIDNFSSGSNQFYHQVPAGQNPSQSVLHNNTILDTKNPVAVEFLNPASVSFVDNTIRSKAGASGPSVSLNNTGAVGGSILSLGNKFSVSNPVSAVGSQASYRTIDDQVVSPASINPVAPSYQTPLNFSRRIIEVAAGASAAAIQNAVNSAVAYQGSRPVVHLPRGVYTINATITIPANLDVQIIGDGYATSLNWAGPSGAPFFTVNAPGKASFQDFRLNGGAISDGILIYSDDSPGARVQVWGATEIDPKAASIFTEGVANTRVNLYGNSPTHTAIRSIGTGVPAAGGVGAWGGGAGWGVPGTPMMAISNHANFVGFDQWFETHGDTLGTFSGAAGNIAIFGSHYFSFQTGKPVVTLDNYSGNFVWGPSHFGFGSIGPITVTNPNPNTKLLVYGALFYQSPFWNVAPGGDTHLIQSFDKSILPTADIGARPSDALIRSMLSLPRSFRITQNTALPAGVTDVIINKVMINIIRNGIHVKRAP